MWDMLLHRVQLATMLGDGLGLIEDGVIGISNGQFVFVGASADLPGRPGALAAQIINGEGRLITPGLVDCHTHLIYGGNRAGEFEQRLAGASYSDIARAGGGIASTVRATAGASDVDLLAATAQRLGALMSSGVTTVEMKSGYGLSVEAELRLLRLIRVLAGAVPARLVPTCLGLHALPAGVSREAFVRMMTDELLGIVATEGLAEAVDAFCETIAFTPAETAAYFARARALGLKVKLHAEQLSNQHGAALAASAGALSADHLEHLDDAGVAAMAASGTVGVLLPAAFHMLRETVRPPIAAMRAAGVPMAVATDSNPGTAPCLSALLAMHLAAIHFGLTVTEALRGMTVVAARALGRADRAGALRVGAPADLALWNVRAPAELVYWMGAPLLHTLIIDGRAVDPDAVSAWPPRPGGVDK